MFASATLTIVLSRKVRNRTAQTAARAAPRAWRSRSPSRLMLRRLRLAGGRSGAAERDQVAQTRRADLPLAVLAHGRARLLPERRTRELDDVDDLRLVRALQRHRGDGRGHAPGSRVARETLDHGLELRPVLKERNLVRNRRVAREELLVGALDLVLGESVLVVGAPPTGGEPDR